ncbi:hypothetical protein [Helicobacter sp. 13S00477-4]|uniref:hypothetical protein n=1 Tax=Helicobacter sp. 13S00477-4 TaxID=1905759 RepID=UPI000BA629B7|nr:hypothetical protein [Helicobacter sp. 13S00477-4]PAF52441.1 hypothetical protein BKH44_02655 [Helicobacter sp. 13S00477-4]
MNQNNLMENNLIEIVHLLENATNKNHIDLAFNQYLKLLGNNHQIQDKTQSKKLINLFRDKIYSLIFSKGDILDKIYLYLYELVDANNEIDLRFEPFIKIAEKNVFSNNINDEENMMLIELGSICKILSGHKFEGITFYIKNICLIDIHSNAAQRSTSFIIKVFETLMIPIDIFIQAMQEILEKNYFFTLQTKQRRSIFNWQLHIFWNIKHFFNHRDWLLLYPLWKEIFYELLDSSDTKKIDEALYVQFFIYHICGNNFTSQEEWKKFNQDITQKASKTYSEFGKKFRLTPSSKHQKPKKIIAFLRDRLVENSPYKVEYSFLKTLIQQKKFMQNYEIKIYLMNFLEKSDNDPLIKKSYEELGIEVIDVVSIFNQEGYYNSHFSKALSIRESIIKNQIDIIISPNNGYGISDFILASKSAQKQIFWSHGNFVYDLPQIDTKITHICPQSGIIKHEGYDFFGFTVPMEEKFYNPPIPEDIIQKEKSKYPQNKIILGLIGRLTKIDSLPYLESIINIMIKKPNSIFLACGTGNIHEIKQKIASININILERFFFPGYINPSIYGHIIDFWPDSFPMEQGESKVEFNAKGGLILNFSKESKESYEIRAKKWIEENTHTIKQECEKMNVSFEEFKKIRIQETSWIAFSQKEYIQKALNLLSLTKNEKQILSDKRLLLRKIYESTRKNNGLESFLKALENV